MAWVRARFTAGPHGLTLTLAVILGASALWLFLGTTQDVAAREEFALLDPVVRNSMTAHHLAWLTAPAHVLSWLGSTVVLVPVLLVASLLVYRATRSWRPAVELLGTYFVAVLLRDLVAALVNQPAPDGSSPGILSTYPSAHTLQAVVAGAVLVHVLTHHIPGRAPRWLVPALIVLTVLAAAAPLYLGTEWLTDITAGLALAAAWLACCAGTRALTRRPAAP